MEIAVLASGSGSNLQALIDHPGIYQITLVLSDRADAYALTRAVDAGIPTAVVEWGGDRDGFTRTICDRAEEAGAEALVLAGFMRILGPEAIRRFPQRILNIHPSLLPAFPGAGAVEQALAHGVKVTGVTVHLVDEEVDHGPIVEQIAVPVSPDDDVDSLHARIQSEEHRLYPRVVDALAGGRLRVRGRHVDWVES